MGWLGRIFFVLVLAYFAYHYARLTDFPIGDDPAIHITNIKNLSYGDLSQLRYPLPLLIFKFVQQVTHISPVQLFIGLISTFLFMGGLLLAMMLREGFGSAVAVAGSLLFVTSRWVNDGLRMGLLAETFGWAIFFLACYCLVKQKWLATVIVTGLLALSHPFAILVFGLLVLLYGITVAIQGEVEERLFMRNLFISYLVLAVLAWLVKPGLVKEFLAFTSADPAGWGDRTLWEIVAGDDRRRMLIPILAVFGGLAALRNWELPAAKLSVLLLCLGIFFSMNYIFGISFIPFRFYAYFEMALAMLGGLGLVYLISQFRQTQTVTLVLTFLLVIPFALINYRVNQRLGHWQATDPGAKAVMLPADREALEWVKENTSPTDAFVAPPRYAIWLNAVSDRSNVQVLDFPYSDRGATAYFSTNQPSVFHYLYYPMDSEVPRAVTRHYHQVFVADGVSIWEVDSANP